MFKCPSTCWLEGDFSDTVDKAVKSSSPLFGVLLLHGIFCNLRWRRFHETIVLWTLGASLDPAGPGLQSFTIPFILLPSTPQHLISKRDSKSWKKGWYNRSIKVRWNPKNLNNPLGWLPVKERHMTFIEKDGYSTSCLTFTERGQLCFCVSLTSGQPQQYKQAPVEGCIRRGWGGGA